MNIADYKFALKLTHKQALFIDLLMTNKVVSVEMMEHDFGVATIARVLVYRIRPKLKPFGIVINNSYKDGYWITEDGKAKVRTLVEESLLGHGSVGGVATPSLVAAT